MAQIGIKLADGTFFPVLLDDSPQKRRVVLSAARPDQSSVQVDLVRRDGEIDQYVGCLVLEDLPVGDSIELELRLALDGTGGLDAQLNDTGRTQYQSLVVNVNQVTEDTHFSLPEDEEIGLIDTADPMDDFDFQPETDSSTSFEADPDADIDTDPDTDDEYYQERKPLNFVVLLALIIVVLSLLALGAWLVLLLLDAEALPQLRSAVLLPLMIRKPRR